MPGEWSDFAVAKTYIHCEKVIQHPAVQSNLLLSSAIQIHWQHEALIQTKRIWTEMVENE